MSWTPAHDVVFCREILFQNPYSEKKKSVQRSAIWDSIADKLSDIDQPKFTVDKRSVRDHISILIKRQKRKVAAEEKASGINPEPTELDNALEQIMALEETADVELAELNNEKKEKVEQDKLTATDMRKKAMEKLGDTQKRQREEGDQKTRKSRRNGNDALQFLKEKADKDMELKREEIRLKQSQQSLEEKRVEVLLLQQKQQQDNQIIQQEQQRQMMNMHMLLMSQQQEQTKALMSLVEKIAHK